MHVSALSRGIRHLFISLTSLNGLFWIPFFYLMQVQNLFAQLPVNLDPLIQGLSRPVLLTHANDGSGRLFIVEQGGLIRIFRNGLLSATPFLDLTNQVECCGERGLLGLAFHPNYRENGRFFVNYTALQPGLKTLVAEFRVSQDPDRTDTASARVVLEFDQPFSNHNGGMLAFGSDGFLYVGTGDGGSGGDPLGNGQNRNTLLGAILRIDIDQGEPYTIPADNPFVAAAGAKPEIWAYGLRNPWRFSFDRSAGALYAGDVGQNSLEEVDLITAGGNYGWNIMEGSQCFSPPTGCVTSDLKLPITAHGRDLGASVTGGYVYRGTQSTSLWGSYIFGDFVSGRIWALARTQSGGWSRKELLDTSLSISSFGEDESGELYVLDYSSGQVFYFSFGWRQIFAHAGDGMASVGVFRTLIALANNGSQPVTGAVQFKDTTGQDAELTINGTRDSVFPFTITPESTVTLETEGSSDPFFTGWAEAVADGPFGGTLLFLLEGDDQLREAGIAASEPGSRFTAVAIREIAAARDTGIAVVNPSASETVSVSIEVKNSKEGIIVQTDFELPPGAQRALFLTELGSIPESLRGTVVIEASGPVSSTVLLTREGMHAASLPAVK